jgi:hypothetical protein
LFVEKIIYNFVTLVPISDAFLLDAAEALLEKRLTKYTVLSSIMPAGAALHQSPIFYLQDHLTVDSPSSTYSGFCINAQKFPVKVRKARLHTYKTSGVFFM